MWNISKYQSLDSWQRFFVLLQVFMAGGRHVNVPCSHAAHMEVKGQRDYRIGNMRNVAKNHIRYVEALFDPIYKETFYYYNPDWKVA